MSSWTGGVSLAHNSRDKHTRSIVENERSDEMRLAHPRFIVAAGLMALSAGRVWDVGRTTS